MTELLTAAQMRAIEAAAIASGEVTGLELMERAGRGVVDAVFAEWPDLAAGSFRAVVLCGPGGNGGDGFVVARLLKEWGWEVEVFLYGDPARMPPDARVNYERWLGLGEVRDIADFDPVRHAPTRQTAMNCWLFDAMFGTGLSRPITGKLAEMIAQLRGMGLGARPAVIAVDMPTGVCSDSGRVVGEAMPAELIVTFHLPKLGHYLADGAHICGTMEVKELGIGRRFPHPTKSTTLISDAQATMSAGLDKGWLLSGAQAHHKFSHGHALILSGTVGHGGAARLAARGALRIGAGVVTVECPPAALIENAARLNAVMLRAVVPEGLAGVLADGRINALCLGPGLGVARAAEMLRVVLGGGGVEPRPTVLDADALTALAGDTDLFAALHPACVLTPHGGEFARLFPDIAARLEAPATKGPAYSKVDAAREAAKRAGCVVLFKGADTVIADPSGRCSVNSAHYDRAAPWLATAGSGDVLAGFICGLLARGFAPMQAAETAAWLHVECARSFGPGLIAEDLPEELPRVFRALEL